MASVSLAPRAQLDLESIALHCAVVLGNPARAEEVAGQLFEALDQLAQFPRLGKVFEHDGLELQYRRLLVQGYWIFYELAGEDVIVRRVIHESQDLDDYALI